MHILSSQVLEWIATGTFYEFLNIYKILKILREQNIVKLNVFWLKHLLKD